jgi:hypothetical protein
VEESPIEVHTDHQCLLGDLTACLAEEARSGRRGELLAERARTLLLRLDAADFARCCVPAYLALAPEQFDREIQLPIASADVAKLDTRVLLWPVGAADGQHPHCDGWAAVMAVNGVLAASEQRDGARQPERELGLCAPELIVPEDGVSHHIHNRGDEIGLTIHIFGT